MQRRLIIRIVLITAGLLGGLAHAQQPANTDTASPGPAPQQSAPTIRSTTRLVQLSVVVTDKKGHPVTGLTKEDFTILDQGAPQEVAFFSSEAPAPVEASSKLPPNVFTNRFDLKGQDPGAVIIILFDAENTATEDQIYLKKQVMSLLRSLKSQDHVAIYALTTELLVLHDFTQDDSALVEAVSKFAPRELVSFDSSFATKISFVGPATGANSPYQNLGQALETPNRQISNQYLKMRMETTTAALKAIANHVAAIPGRKSLLWVSGGFPIQIGVPIIGRPSDLALATSQATNQSARTVCSDVTNQLECPEDETGTFDDQVKQAVRELNRANVAIYPVDAHGVAVDPSASVGGVGAGITAAGRDRDSSQTTATLSAEQDNRDTSRLLADGSGGVAFFGTNDVTNALQKAFDDSRYAYTLGFYPDHNKWNGSFRKLKVTAKTEGVHLRYRTGYFATADKTEADSLEPVKDAAMSPLDATSLGMIVSGKTMEPAEDRKLELHIALDPKQFVLQSADGHKTGTLLLYIVQSDATGVTISAENQRIGLNMEDKQYEYLASAGMVLGKHITILPQAVQFRVLVRDTASGALGSVTIPVAGILEAPKPPVAPSKLETPK
jgi:VWFA-related protein